MFVRALRAAGRGAIAAARRAGLSSAPGTPSVLRWEREFSGADRYTRRPSTARASARHRRRYEPPRSKDAGGSGARGEHRRATRPGRGGAHRGWSRCRRCASVGGSGAAPRCSGPRSGRSLAPVQVDRPSLERHPRPRGRAEHEGVDHLDPEPHRIGRGLGGDVRRGEEPHGEQGDGEQRVRSHDHVHCTGVPGRSPSARVGDPKASAARPFRSASASLVEPRRPRLTPPAPRS